MSLPEKLWRAAAPQDILPPAIRALLGPGFGQLTEQARRLNDAAALIGRALTTPADPSLEAVREAFGALGGPAEDAPPQQQASRPERNGRLATPAGLIETDRTILEVLRRANRPLTNARIVDASIRLEA